MLPEEILSNYHNDAQGLAEYFSNEYFKEHFKVFPINPFQVLTDLGIHFVFRNFDKLEGLYMPAVDGSKIDLVIINAKRPITRQRYSAAHELCHYLKDRKENNDSFICQTGSKSYVEKYADAFASAFLMPQKEIREQISIRGRDEKLSLDDVLAIAEHFGTSFEACYYRIKNLFPYLVPEYIKTGKKRFKPAKRREELGFNDVGLLSDVFDAWEDSGFQYSSEFAKQVFKNQYIYNDSRLEGVEVTHEEVAEIIEDLQSNTQNSQYCNEHNENYCNVAGHAAMYGYVFDMYDRPTGFSLYEIFSLNLKLFSCVPYPEYGGKLRQTNTLVTGAKFETTDYQLISDELNTLSQECAFLESSYRKMSRSEIIKQVARIHHRITVIHPFGDGNGRTSRGYLNESLMRYGLLPFYIKAEKKDEYNAALALADKANDYSKLYEFFMKAIITAHVELSIAG